MVNFMVRKKKNDANETSRNYSGQQNYFPFEIVQLQMFVVQNSYNLIQLRLIMFTRISFRILIRIKYSSILKNKQNF